MAVLTLNRIFVNLMATGQAVSAPSTGRARQHQLTGEVRTFAGGRQRAISQAGDVGQFSFTMRKLTLDQAETLKSWCGRAVQVRDHRGQRFFGVYHQVTITEWKDPALYDVAATAHTITVAEGV